MRREFTGRATSPCDPRHNSSFLYLPSTDELYSASFSDMAGSDPLIYRKTLSQGSSSVYTGSAELRTPRFDFKCLNGGFALIFYFGVNSWSSYVCIRWIMLRSIGVYLSNCRFFNAQLLTHRLDFVCLNGRFGF